MSGNTIGTLFRVTTWGESHGKAVGVVVDGCPPKLKLGEEEIQEELDRRRPGGKSGSPRKEPDKVQILSGLYSGMTSGAPISMIIYNVDQDPLAYDELQGAFRPGHGDYAYYKKYGIRDPRGGGRGSARETVARVAGGAVAKRLLKEKGITVRAFTLELGGVEIERIDWESACLNPFNCPDMAAYGRMEKRLAEIRKRGDTVGGVVGISAQGCPPGMGEPVFDKLDADLAKAVMGIGAVKGLEIGDGFKAARVLGSRNNDALIPKGFESNHAGGILGGISSGQEIWIRAAVKPIPSISLPQKTMDEKGRNRTITVRGRHDTCAIPRILPVCEAMVGLVLVDHLLRHETMKIG